MSDYSYYALIMAAMRMADTDNTAKLEQVFPQVADELRRRYHAPGGLLPGDKSHELGYGMDENGRLYELTSSSEQEAD